MAQPDVSNEPMTERPPERKRMNTQDVGPHPTVHIYDDGTAHCRTCGQDGPRAQLEQDYECSAVARHQ